MARRQWWERPHLRIDEELHRERKVSWLELFFDLVFVVVIAEVAHYLATHLSATGVLGYALLFVTVWWVWIGGTYYNERFETEDISYRVFTFGLMLPTAAMAVFAHDALGKTSTHFAWSYAAARVLITLLWLRGGWHAREFRPVSNRYAIGFTISIILFLVSTAVPIPVRFWLWAVALLIDLITPMFTLKIQMRLPRFSSKLPERFGLFVIIVLGEAIVGAVQGVASRESVSLPVAVAAVLGLALAFCIWWVYFDFVARRRPRQGSWWYFAWNYLHLPLVMGIAAVGAAVLNVLTQEESALSGTFWLLAGAVALTLAAIGLLELVQAPAPNEPTDPRISVSLKLGAALVALALGAWGTTLTSISGLSLLLGLLLVQMAYGVYVWLREPISSSESSAVLPSEPV